jgi:hypothetical protein
MSLRMFSHLFFGRLAISFLSLYQSVGCSGEEVIELLASYHLLHKKYPSSYRLYGVWIYSLPMAYPKKGQLGIFDIGGLEKEKSLDMIPVGRKEKKVKGKLVTLFFKHFYDLPS